ncbi:hypothetical protein SCG7109_AA_00210 [Chlamydiales bacterium SCGC AG-110-M15]|nr:hypothetical protein SCG7109_AA_00210 [Chlamydiales bacterium SCGC AG-110-M15]
MLCQEPVHALFLKLALQIALNTFNRLGSPLMAYKAA